MTNYYIVLALDGSEYDSEGNEVANSQMICKCMAANKADAIRIAEQVLKEREHVFEDLYAYRLHDDEAVYC